MQNKKPAIAFLVITFGVSWSATGFAWFSGARSFVEAGISTLIYDFGPAFSAIICSANFNKGEKINALGVRGKVNLWWLAALLLPVFITVLSIGITILLSGYGALGLEALAGKLAEIKNQHFASPISFLAVYILVQLAVLTVMALPEELGWRGYLYTCWRFLGFWRYSFVVGLLWGLWHWPIIYLFGLNFPEHRELGLVWFPIYTMAFSPLMTLFRDRGVSIWPAVILHGASNAFFPLALHISEAPEFPWFMGSFTAALIIFACLILCGQRSSKFRAVFSC